MTLSKTRAAIMAGVLLASGAASGVALAYQGHMFQARNALYAARSQLLAARHNKGGHRVAALRAVDAAIAQVNIGIRVGR
ncbi:hypothetical protein AiwAL_10715 [Acidiphilium sp. AL]|uniref:Uncharacterized protein n=1 Tax=Acidiphilium iwatense TaxID=768198 RepID=A0ABS9DQY7_9PROT|nr:MULTISPECIES: hypothetical protein [Acidiphilium]MCF3945082.1 hypothetical protein [Acidiphilium iwatense]MCU4160573.1 hypothetical protein [Acidiphilium sp. AL]